MIFRIVTCINIGLIMYTTVYYIITNYKFIKIKMKKSIVNLNIFKTIENKLSTLSEFSKLFKIISPSIIIFISVLFSLSVYFIAIISLKIISTAILLSLIALIIPYMLINTIIQLKINRIRTMLPSYIVNLKSNIEVNNNIIKSINITNVEEPLKSKIDLFNFKVSKGINVYKCFDELKKSVNIDTFSSLINAFKVCYLNGGDYITVINKYIDITSKENMQKAKLKENSNTTILTLGIMVIINIFLLFSVILENREYSRIVLETMPGHVIINFGIVSYLVIGYFVYKIYKMEG